jgi:hypothetical protein
MTVRIEDFLASLDGAAPAPGQPPLLDAVWHALAGAWDRAHTIAQAHEEDGPDAAWVHAWLHRIEGDLGNAGYWYRRAGRPPGTGDLPAEGRTIAAALIGKG